MNHLLTTPKFMPAREPDRIETNEIFEYRPVPGITLHNENDGIILYYDQPLVFVAWIDYVQYFVTITEDDYEGPPEVAKGWTQYIAIAVPYDYLLEVYNSVHPFRAAYDTSDVTVFIHETWNHYKNEEGKSAWNTEYKIWKDIPVENEWKPDEGVYLDPNKPKAV